MSVAWRQTPTARVPAGAPYYHGCGHAFVKVESGVVTDIRYVEKPDAAPQAPAGWVFGMLSVWAFHEPTQ